MLPKNYVKTNSTLGFRETINDTYNAHNMLSTRSALGFETANHTYDAQNVA